MLCNDTELVLDENDNAPEFVGEKVTGIIEIAPTGCTFIVI